MLITKVRHSTVIIETSQHTIYLDPYLDPLVHAKLPKADLILISNPDYDHGTQQSVNLVSSPDTRVYGPLRASDDINLDTITSGQTREAGNASFTVTRADNPDTQSQGYLIDADGQTLYYPGDTRLNQDDLDHVCTILFLPITTGLMDADDCLHLVRALHPRIVIPVHFGLLTGTDNDAYAIKRTIEDQTGSKCIVLRDGESVEI